MYRAIFRIIFLLLPVTGFNQIVQPLGQTPASLRWQQINTSHFRIIYPRGMEDDAQRAINAMENAYYDVGKSMGMLPRKIPIVLQNQTTDNNAFVTSEGRRAEFFSTPPQNPNSQGMNNWIDELSLHEFRHVVQQDQTLRGWGKLMYYIFGYSGTSVTQGLTNPWWFFEGDAVGCESALGYGGRGRIPSFDITFRATLMDHGPFSYDKAACGSFKNAIPNHYVLGYFMTTYVKNHFGADIWNKILTRAYTKPPLPFSFSRSIKKLTGKNVQQTYTAMTGELKELWSKQVENIHETPVTYYTHASNKVFTNYKYPQFLADGNIVAQKAGLADGSFLAYKSSIADQSWFIVLSKDGKEKKVCLSGVLDDNGMMSSAGDKVVWTEYTYDPRWGARNYTVIKTLDVTTKKVKQLTHRSRLHAPCFSPDGSIIAAINFSTAGKYQLQLLDATNGKMIKAFPNPSNRQLMQPRFTRDGHSIVVLEAKPGTKSILKINIETGEITTILPPVTENISSPVDGGQYIFYNSSQSGIDNIYAVDPVNGEQYQVTNRKYGASNPCVSPDGTTVSFQDFTPSGYRIAQVPLDANTWIKLADDDPSTEKVEYFRKFSAEEKGNILSHIPDSVYPASKYKRVPNAIGVYSWGLEPLSNARRMSIGIRSQDMLSTTILEAGFRYDNDEDGFGKYLKLSYLGLYPELSFMYDDGKRIKILPGEAGEAPFDYSSYSRFAYRDAGIGVSLPLNLSSGKYIRKLTVGINGTYTDLYGQVRTSNGKKLASQNLGNLHSISYNTSLEIRERQSIRDVAPRWGGSFSFLFQQTPFKDIFNGSQLALTGHAYLPGFAKHDAFKLSGNWQKDINSNYHFQNSFPFVRGAPNDLFNQLGIWSVDYKMPLFYPDRGVLGGAFYFQRVKADLFTEIGRGKRFTLTAPGEEVANYTSMGIELTSDVNFMRFLVPFDAGFRYSYVLQRHAGRIDFLVSLPIF
ncbi:MAG: hypothetical protein Q8941_21885 [Bacteroidota bacterium]|nr:hypothetical protein [Bacteroidota bacterium]